MEAIISFDIANFKGVTQDALIQFLQQNIQEAEFFESLPIPGRIYAASRGSKMLTKLNEVSGILGLALAFYSTFIAPNKEPSSNSGIILRIENAGHDNQFWIGNDIRTQSDLEDKIKERFCPNKLDTIRTQKEIDSIKNSGRWRQIK